MTKAKQKIKEIKEDNSIDKNEQNIAEIVDLKDFSKQLIDSPLTGMMMIDSTPTDKEIIDINVSDNNKDDSNRLNFLSLIDRVIFPKWYIEITLVINKEFSLTEIALIDLGVDMNCIQEGLIPFKYYEKSSARLKQANGENLIIPNVYICNDGICFETIFVLIKDLPFKIILGTPFMALLHPYLMKNEGIKTNLLEKDILF